MINYIRGMCVVFFFKLFSVKHWNFIHIVNIIGITFTDGCATRESMSLWGSRDETNFDLSQKMLHLFHASKDFNWTQTKSRTFVETSPSRTPALLYVHLSLHYTDNVSISSNRKKKIDDSDQKYSRIMF